ncbi:AAA family ATPase [Microcoleus sp. Pol11C3]|uniref:PAS domain S-box protein n=1 Tax=Microcoleus sp. Pol11C3 TaxID=3055390 RepID=UPI002FD474BC
MDTITDLPGYRITEQLYAGSRTLVYRGIRESDRTPVVIKLLRNEYPSFSELLQFRNQYTIAKNLHLPSIVKPLDLVAYKNAYALIMEDCGGVSLCSYVKAATDQNQPSQSVFLENFLNKALQLADILHSLYQNRVIHKDIKPANILINPDSGQIKLIDFSIASLLPRETQEIHNPNILEGTLAYLSPEQTGRMNRGIDYRSDFYSLGVTFYELLTRQLPFESDDPMELVHCHLAKEPIPVYEIDPAVPLILSQIVSKLMAKNAESRYQSALGLKHDLEICIAQLQKTGKIETFTLGTRDITDRFLIPEKLYGREIEVDNLLAAFERVSMGSTEMMLVAGFSGIGKTAVVNEVHKPIVRQRGYFIKGKYDQFQRNIPFSAFVQAFRDLMGQLLSESDAEIEQWKTKILVALGDNGQVIIEVIPELERIIGQQPPAPELSGIAAQNLFNLLFQKFISVFTTKEHPLVMFLDDLQWADSASLKLMQFLIGESQSSHLLLIGAYRDNEVSAAHPLMLTLDEVTKTGATVNTITLAPLARTSLNQLVADTLTCSPKLAEPLTELVYQKTKGNPFFATQFLKALHHDGLIIFDIKAGYWHCHISQITEAALTDDVVEFMAQQLQKLPVETQSVLKVAACMGNQFDLTTLAIVSQISETETATALWKTLQEGFVLPQSEIYKFYVGEEEKIDRATSQTVSYRFLHDRVQQAAYSLIAADKKQPTHLKIGQLLLQNTPSQEREEQIFAIVNQLNVGLELISQPAELEELARLNLTAGRKAKASTAYAAAVKYLSTAMDLLSGESWQNQYDLTLEIVVEAADAQYLNTNFAAANTLVEMVLQHGKTLLDRIPAYEIKIQVHMAQHQLNDAIDTGLQALELLGYPVNLSEQEFLVELPTLECLEDYPTMTDPAQLAAMRILKVSFAPVLVGRPQILLPVIVRQVKLCVEGGHSPLASATYAWYGTLLCGPLGNIDIGYQAGRLALQLLKHFETREHKVVTYNMFYTFVHHWKEPLRESLSPLAEGVQIGLESGNYEYTGYCITNYCFYIFLAGQNLETVESEHKKYHDLLLYLKWEHSISISQIWYQLLLNLLGKAVNPLQLIGEIFDEYTMLSQLLEHNDLIALFHAFLAKTILFYLLEDFEEAVESAAKAAIYYNVGSENFVALHFYQSLALLANYPNVSLEERSHYLSQVDANQEKMQLWMQHAPMNYEHKYYLVTAEKHRVFNQKKEALEFYDLAIVGAKENKYLQEEAIANELAAKFYLDWGKEKVAASYMQEAYYCYARWGAKAKVRHLEERYPQLLQSIAKRETVSINSTQPITSTTMTDTSILDLATVMKASQVLAGEIVLNNLLAKLLKIVLENAGASSGFLILDRGSDLWIEAAGTLESDQVFVPQPVSVQNSLLVPLSIINYVARTQQDVVLDDARISENFLKDSYIKLHQPKSVLCATIQGQGQLIGLVYLENNLTTSAFTPNRLSVVRMLCSLAAISLQNAQLYDQLGEYSRTLERKVIERTQELQQEMAVRTQAEIALGQSEEKFSKAFRSSPNPIALARFADGRYIEVNDSFLSTFSYSREEVIGFTAIELNLWVNLEECDRYRQLLQESGVLRNQEFDCRTSAGEVRKMLVSADIIELGGEACILLVTNDITDRQRVEEALKESEGKYRDLVETSQDMIWSVDAEGRYTFVNAAVKQIFGYSPEEMIGRKFSDFKTPEQLLKDNEIFQSLLNGESVFHYETIQLAKDSRPINLRANAIVVRDSEGNILGITGTTSDITESKKAEAALQQAKEVADAANKAKSEFLSKMSHELRTPLNAILGFTQVLGRDSSLSHIQQEHIGIISRSGEHLLTLINDVLEMSKIEAGQITLNPTSFDLYYLLTSLEEMLKLKADSKGLALSLHINPNITQYVKTDESKLRQVLINLLGNAIKFTTKGSVTLRVAAISATKQKSPTDNELRTITFEVEDTGHGIAPTEVDSLFEAFVQTDAGRKSQEGTGLGLPISRQFVQLMGGDITVSSTLNRGTIFSFNIQISSPDMAEIQPRQSTKRVIGLEPNQTPYRILVVDDKWESRLLLVNLLEPLGLEVREAVNGEEAIRIWETWKPHLIWMDMQMPVIDGYEATRQIKAKIQEEATPIVALTASAFEEERAIVLASGCDDFVSKPFREEVIFAKMAEHLGVQYIYEDLPNFTLSQLEGQDLSVTAGEKTENLRTTLATLPAEWVTQLHQAAIDADAELILNLVAAIPESNTSFAEAIADWANNFRFDKITNLTE